MHPGYIESMALVERLHRRFLDVVRTEIERMGQRDINNVQALILFNISDQELTVGELTSRGYYLGTNVSYNLKKLVEHGYVTQRDSERDRRTVRVALSAKGRGLHGRLSDALARQAAALDARGVGSDEWEEVCRTLRTVEHGFAEMLALPPALGRPDAFAVPAQAAE